MKCWVAWSSNEEIVLALGNKLEALWYLWPRGSPLSPSSWISLSIYLCFCFSFNLRSLQNNERSGERDTLTAHLSVGYVCVTNDVRFTRGRLKGPFLISMEFKWEFGYHCWFAESFNVNLLQEKYLNWAKLRRKNVFGMDDFPVFQFHPPASSPCCSLPGQAVKRAVLLRTSSRRDSTTGSALSPMPPSLPRGLDWCVPALFSRRITGIIEWRVVLRTKL